MKPSEITNLLIRAFSKKRKVLITGEPGIGKTDVVAAAADAVRADLLVAHPAVSDPTDFKGMPAIIPSDGTLGPRAEFLPFGDLRALMTATCLTVCFLDDIGQAPHAVQAALMQLILARQVNGHKISDHVVFCGATNDSSHRAGVNALLEPVKSRFDTIVKMVANLNDWCQWAFKNGMPVELIAFVRFRPELLSKFEPTRELTNSPNPRTVAALGRWYNEGVTDSEVYTGCVGAGFSTEFIGFLRVFKTLPNLDSILMSPNNAPVPMEPATLYAVTTGLVRKMTKDNAGRAMTYAARLPDEHHMCLVRDADRAHDWFKATPEFTRWTTQYGKWLM